MFAAGFQIGRDRGEDRFYNSAKTRRANHNRQHDQPRKALRDASATKPLSCSVNAGRMRNRERDDRLEREDPQKPVAAPDFEPLVPSLSNLERFFQSVTPSVPAQYISKTTMRGWRTFDQQCQPYFVLGDLWESFKEWSAYGAGVPLILNDSDSVVQYYVPYLSGLQLYGDSLQLSAKSRLPGADSDSDFRDSSSDGSSDSEPERALKHVREHNGNTLYGEIPLNMDRLLLRDQRVVLQEDCSSDEAETGNSRGCLLFEYLEHDLPYSREPLADKILDLAFRFPELKTLRSFDLLPSSWISVAWYPIYRIPTGPSLRDLDACFLTYHSLFTPHGGAPSSQAPVLTHTSEADGISKMSLPVFGLASYKFKGSLWTPNGGFERQLAHSLLQSADNWLRRLQVNHPDFLFFSRR